MYFYMRMHPHWYLILSRYPDRIDTFINHYKQDNHCTINDYISKIGTLVQMIEMLI
ncbi:MAG: hypothetical protein LUF02_03430 [Erysipelotrichaceae bacterium]|nr:hypothetical protein [Erysipelotrichaceae bacterium]